MNKTKLSLTAVLVFGLPCSNCVGSVVEWLKPRARDQHGLGSKPNRAILLCPWERHFTALSLAWWSWKAVLNYSQVGVIAYPMYSAFVAFLRVRRINTEIK